MKDEQQEETPPGVEGPDERGPFEGNSVRLAVTREINVAQLQSEISQRLRSEVQVAIQTDSPTHIASEQRPVTLFVSPSGVSERVIQAVVDNHVAKQVGQPVAGVDPDQPSAGFNVASLTPEGQALAQKLAEGKDLKVAEASDLLRAILGIEIQD